jgi:hypothetical protein
MNSPRDQGQKFWGYLATASFGLRKSATRTADAMSIAENKQDCVPGLVPADGTMLPIGQRAETSVGRCF